jgi:hypothetical protein
VLAGTTASPPKRLTTRENAWTRIVLLRDLQWNSMHVAAARGFTVATHDITPFQAARLNVINPWEMSV